MFAVSVTLLPVWLGIAWFSIKVRGNITADAEPEFGRFVLTILAPYAVVMLALFVAWRVLQRLQERFSEQNPWGRY